MATGEGEPQKLDQRENETRAHKQEDRCEQHRGRDSGARRNPQLADGEHLTYGAVLSDVRLLTASRSSGTSTLPDEAFLPERVRVFHEHPWSARTVL